MQEEVRLRPAARQFLTLPLFAVAVIVTAILLTRRVPFLVLPLALLLMIPQVYGVRLTDTHLVYLRLLGPQRLAWSAITYLEERKSGTSVIVIVHSSVSRDRLVTPRQGWVLRDPRYDEKVDVLKGWWVAHRGRNWKPSAR